MIRIKKVHKSLVFYVITIYVLALLSYQQLLARTGERVLEQVVEFENYSWVKLSEELYVLSAYHETRPIGEERTNFVRVLTIARHKKDLLVKKSARDLQPKTYGKGAFDVECRVAFDDDDDSIEVEYEAVIFEEGGERFAATFINCFLPTESDKTPTYVFLTEKQNTVKVPVKRTTISSSAGKHSSDKTAVCVRSLFGPYDNLNQLGIDIINHII